MDRRAFLQSVAATAAVAVIPTVPGSDAAPVAVSAPAQGPAWAVGTDGDWNWDVVRAATESEAINHWKEKHFGFVCECKDEPDTCDACNRGPEAERRPKWDNIHVIAGDPTWFKAGMGASCSRCFEESFFDQGDHVVESAIVCQGCMTLSDWDIVDPEHAAELREDAA